MCASLFCGHATHQGRGRPGDSPEGWHFHGGPLPRAKRVVEAGPKANEELARDLASFGIDGGCLVIGVDEDKEGRMFRLAPQPLKGFAERVEQVADTRIQPRLVIRCREISTSTDKAVGYLLIEIPPSPTAPHMVGNRYYGRGTTTKHALSDPEVERIFARRQALQSRVAEILSRDVERDPTPPSTRQQAHLFICAAPAVARPSMLLKALTGSNRTMAVWARNLLPNAGAMPTWIGHFEPDLLGGIEVSTRASGIGVHSWEIGPGRVVRSPNDHAPKEWNLLDIEIDEDGTIHLFAVVSRPGTDTDGRFFLTRNVLGLFIRAIRIAVIVSETMSYLGSWSIGVHINNLRGVTSGRFFGHVLGLSDRPSYTGSDYTAIDQFLTDDLRAHELSIVSVLLGQLYRGLGENIDTMPDTATIY